MNTVQRLTEILNSPRLRANSKNFVESMLEQAKKKDLSEKQLEYVNKFWAECFPPQEVVEEEQAWIDAFTDEMRENVHIMGQYYEKHYPTSRLAKNYNDANWLPTKEVYEKSVASDWGKRVITNYKSEFRFKIGEMCVLRDTARNRSSYKYNMGNPLLILDCVKNPTREFTNYYVVVDTTRMEEQMHISLPESSVNIIKHKKGQ